MGRRPDGRAAAHDLFSFGIYTSAGVAQCMFGQQEAAVWFTVQNCANTILTLSKDEKYMSTTPGIVSILHNCGQDLTFHPHVHNIVSDGGIDAKGNPISDGSKRRGPMAVFCFDVVPWKRYTKVIF